MIFLLVVVLLVVMGFIMVFLLVMVFLVVVVIMLLSFHVGHGEFKHLVGDSVLRSELVNKFHGVSLSLSGMHLLHNSSVKSHDAVDRGAGDLRELVKCLLGRTFVVASVV